MVANLGSALIGRETEVLSLIAQAKTRKEIALLLNLSVHTVGNHRKRLCAKLDLHSTAELVACAVSPGARTNALSRALTAGAT